MGDKVLGTWRVIISFAENDLLIVDDKDNVIASASAFYPSAVHPAGAFELDEYHAHLIALAPELLRTLAALLRNEIEKKEGTC
jgi:hypothetical protein